MTASTTAVRTHPVEYEHDGAQLQGFLALDGAARVKRPGVLVFPEWWGLNENARRRARRLAELGYVALAADVYGGGKLIGLDRPDEAAGMAAALRADPAVWRGRALVALEQLAYHPGVDASRVAAIGHCLDSALQLAYAGAALKGVVTFHSVLPVPTGAEAAAVRAEVLVCVGGADPFVPAPVIDAFRAPLDAVGVRVEVVTYPGVAHSFTSPDAGRARRPGLRYDKGADEDSWRRMLEFLAAALGADDRSESAHQPRLERS